METISILLLGTLVGNEIAVGAFIHPALWKLTDDQHAAAARGIARTYGVAAPPWYAATLISLVFLAFQSGIQPERYFVVAAVALMASSLFMTFVGPLPINNRVTKWNLNDLPLDWKSDRKRWDILHDIRTVILLAAFIFLVLGR